MGACAACIALIGCCCVYPLRKGPPPPSQEVRDALSRQWIVYERNLGSIALCRGDGTGSRYLLRRQRPDPSGAEVRYASPSISPDGTRFSCIRISEASGSVQSYSLVVGDLGKRSSPRIVLDSPRRMFSPIWSQDGNAILFFEGEEVRRFDLSGTEVSTLAVLPKGTDRWVWSMRRRPNRKTVLMTQDTLRTSDFLELDPETGAVIPCHDTGIDGHPSAEEEFWGVHSSDERFWFWCGKEEGLNTQYWLQGRDTRTGALFYVRMLGWAPYAE